MKQFKVRGHGEHDEYLYDVKRIQSVLRSRDYECSYEQARMLWIQYSESMAAGWMHLPEDDEELFWHVQPYMVENVEGLG